MAALNLIFGLLAAAVGMTVAVFIGRWIFPAKVAARKRLEKRMQTAFGSKEDGEESTDDDGSE